ncbi:hypothetical protein HFP57_05500 [Parasphingopyxis algicola]|uniref:hypothetical protein n=1 Tax=Parasphingopyxis algicola TaxID=2026624 RepID=UPI0015A31AEE|nr:hypothetical protein [Parasphingopyxis algicola]QLC24531.1 hypothetical protein HFP57_05500 [Parasphingopyxis algicola]
MRISTRILSGSAAGLAALALTACGGGTETATTDEDTAVTDVDPGEGDGTINDTTLIDGTIGAEEAMGMESRMPADTAESRPSAPAAETGGPEPASLPTDEPEAEAPAEDDDDNDSGEGDTAE